MSDALQIFANFVYLICVTINHMCNVFDMGILTNPSNNSYSISLLNRLW